MAEGETLSETNELRVMLVDDADDVRYLISAILAKDPSIEVVAEASDGRAALATATEHSPDVIVLDVGLPGRSGLDLIPELRRAVPNARIVVLTGDHRPELNAAVIASGAHAYLAKRDASKRLLDVIAAMPGNA